MDHTAPTLERADEETENMQPARRPRNALLVAVGIALVAGSVVFVARHAGGASELLGQAGSLDPRLASLGLMCSAIAIVNRGLLNRAAHRAVGLDAGAIAMTRTAAVGFAAQKMVKSAGAVGLAVFVRDGRRRGHAPGTVAAACVLSAVSSFVALGVLLLSAVVVLAVTDRLTGWWIAAAIGFGLYAVAVTLVGFVVLRSRRIALGLWARGQRLHRRLWRRRRLQDGSPGFPSHLFDALTTARSRPGALRALLVHGVASKALGALMLVAAVSAVGLPVSASGAIVVYATALAASMVTIVPGGVGTVEGSTTALLVASGAPLASAAIAVLLFRFFDLLLPVLAGAVAARGRVRPEPAVTEPLPPALSLAAAA